MNRSARSLGLMTLLAALFCCSGCGLYPYYAEPYPDEVVVVVYPPPPPPPPGPHDVIVVQSRPRPLPKENLQQRLRRSTPVRESQPSPGGEVRNRDQSREGRRLGR